MCRLKESLISRVDANEIGPISVCITGLPGAPDSGAIVGREREQAKKSIEIGARASDLHFRFSFR